MTDCRRPTFIAFEQPRPQRSSNRQVGSDVPFKPPAKRRGADAPSSCPESLLMSLCRGGKWERVLARCETHPQEAVPVLRQECSLSAGTANPRKRDRKSDVAATGSPNAIASPVHEKTPLGIVCESPGIPSDTKSALLRALLKASPKQLFACQSGKGCTPLRDLVACSTCEVEHLEILLSADTHLSVTEMKDMSGLLPVDHLVMRLHLDPSDMNVKLFCCYVDNVEIHGSRLAQVSPLIRLLSLASNHGASSDQSYRAILQCTKYLLERNPSRINGASKTTGCTVLHMALRNFGDHQELIQLLLSVASKSTLASRNAFGDLPLHVACAGGSPMEILHLLLQATAEAAPMPAEGPHPLLWSTNSSGYTLVDLEWMRHIEGGGGLFERRTFYPLEERGLRRCQSPRQEGLYHCLLRKAVGQVMGGKQGTHSFGALLDRILLIVQMSYSGRRAVDDAYILHAASSLAGADGPHLPHPLLYLIHFMHKEQTKFCDERGRLPLHYVLMNHNRQSGEEVSKSSETKDHVWVATLIDSFPRGARIADKKRRLPLHCALDNPCLQSTIIIDELVRNYPESLERRDPISGLYPFQQAADCDLNTCYRLLRRSPNLVASALHNS